MLVRILFTLAMSICVSCIANRFEGSKDFSGDSQTRDLGVLDDILKGYYGVHFRMECLSKCLGKIHRDELEKNATVFYEGNFMAEEILVEKYLENVGHDVDLFNHGSGTKEVLDEGLSYSRGNKIKNVVIFLHDLDNFKMLDKILGQGRIDRKGKFVICLSSSVWTEKKIVEIFKFMWKFKVANMIFVISDAQGKIQVYTSTPMDPEKCTPSKLYLLIDDCNSSKQLKKSNLFVRTMRNMNMCPLIASSLSIAGAAKIYSENGVRKVAGWEGEIFNSIADKMNFTRVLTPELPGLWGDQLPNGTWNGIHGNILNGKTDVGFCIMFPATDRLDFEEYSNPIMNDRYVWILPKALPTNWNKLLLPFKKYAWIATLISVMLVLGAMHLATTTKKVKRPVLLQLWGLTFGQAMMSTIGNRRVTKFIIVLWVFCAFVLTNAYLTGLVSFLTTTKNVRNLNRIEELLWNDVPYGGTKTPAEFYNDPDAPGDYKIFENFEIMPLEKCVTVANKILHGQINYAIVVPEVSLHASKYVGSWHRMKEIALTYPVTFVFPIGSPYISEFNIYITRLVEGGLIDFWIRSNTTGSSPSQFKPIYTPLKLVHVASIFSVWFIGIAISSLVFLVEILYHHSIAKK